MSRDNKLAGFALMAASVWVVIVSMMVLDDLIEIVKAGDGARQGPLAFAIISLAIAGILAFTGARTLTARFDRRPRMRRAAASETGDSDDDKHS